MIGMPYKILPPKEFSKELRKLDPQIIKRVKAKIEEVAEDPTWYKKLHYDLKESSRIRIGKFRVLFSFDEKKEELYPEKIISDHDYTKN
jgi:mRNA-degrading endonuclease RelE of RelBE toxin-antitoxin system